MKAILLLTLAALSCGAQTLPFHPYRKVGDTYYDLQPLYTWVAKRVGSRPMEAWIGPGTVSFDRYGIGREKLGKNPILDDMYFVRGVTEAGLLLEIVPLPHPPGSTRMIFLRNYPGYTNCVDDQRINFLALRAGNHQYSDSAGALRTVPLYDYGIPYDPQKLLAERSRTNAPAEKSEQ